MGNSHVTIVNDPSSGVKSDAPNCSVTYDRHYDDRNSFIIQATDDLKKKLPNFSKNSPKSHQVKKGQNIYNKA
jgi:hypothetical protein